MLRFAAAICLLASAASAAVAVPRISVGELESKLNISLQRRQAIDPNDEIYCAEIRVIYSEPTSKTYSMQLNKAQLSGVSTIDTSFALSAGIFQVEVVLASSTSGATTCAEASDLTVSTVGSTTTYGSDVAFYGRTADKDFYTPTAQEILVICVETATAGTTDERSAVHFAPLFTEVTACAQINLGDECTVSLAAGHLNDYANGASGAAVFDFDYVQQFDVVSVKDAISGDAFKNNDFFFKSQVTTSGIGVTRADIQAVNDGAGTYPFATTNIGNFKSVTSGTLTFKLESSLQKIAYTGTIADSDTTLSANSKTCTIQAVASAYVICSSATPFVNADLSGGASTDSGASLTGLSVQDYFPSSFEVVVRASGTAGTDADDTCTIGSDCLSATSSFTVAVKSAAEVTVGAYIAHAPRSAINSGYVPLAESFVSEGSSAWQGSNVPATFSIDVTDEDLSSSALAQAPNNLYTEAISYTITLVETVQKDSQSCSLGTCAFLACPEVAGELTSAQVTAGYTDGGVGLTVSQSVAGDVATLTISWSPVYDTVSEEVFRTYGETYCTYTVQSKDATATGFDATAAAAAGIDQTFSAQLGTQHTFLLGAKSHSEADYTSFVAPQVTFSGMPQSTFKPSGDSAAETSGSITVQFTNRADNSNDAYLSSLGVLSAKASCESGDIDTGLVSSGNSLCCTPLTSTTGAAPTCSSSSSTACDGSAAQRSSGCGECSQTLTFTYKDSGVFTTAGDYNLCWAFISSQYPFPQSAVALDNVLTASNSRRGAREEQEVRPPQTQTIYLDIDSDSVMTVRVDNTTIVVDNNQPTIIDATDGAPVTTPTPVDGQEAASDTQIVVLGMIGGGVLLLVTTIIVAIVLFKRKQSVHTKVYPFFMPGTEMPPAFDAKN